MINVMISNPNGLGAMVIVHNDQTDRTLTCTKDELDKVIMDLAQARRELDQPPLPPIQLSLPRPSMLEDEYQDDELWNSDPWAGPDGYR